MEKNDLTQKLYEELFKRGLYEQEEDEEDEEEEDDDEQEEDDDDDDVETNSVSDVFCELTCMILHSRTQAHVFHLGVKGPGAFAAHLALQAYYEGIIPLLDGLVEAYQGQYGLIKFQPVTGIDNDCDIKNIISYYKFQLQVSFIIKINKHILMNFVIIVMVLYE